MEEIISLEWKVMRDQLRRLSGGLADVRRAADEARAEASVGLAELRAELRRGAAEGADTEQRGRAGGEGDLAARLDALADGLEAGRCEQQRLEDSLGGLREELDALHPALRVLRGLIDQDVADRSADKEMIMESLREHDRLIRESQARDAWCRSALDGLRGAAETDRAACDRAACDSGLFGLDSKLRDIEELRKTLEGVAAEVAEVAAEACEKIDAEGAAFRLREEEMEQRLEASRSSLQGVLAQQAEGTRRELRRQIGELRDAMAAGISEERAGREVAVLRLEEKIAFMSNFFADIGQRFGGPDPGRSCPAAGRSERARRPSARRSPDPSGAAA